MDQALGDLPGITVPAAPADRTHVYYQYCVYGPQRDELVVKCVRRGIDIETLHVDVCSDLELFAGAPVEPAGAPGAHRAAQAMQIPVYSSLTDEQTARVARVVRGVLAPRRRNARLPVDLHRNGPHHAARLTPKARPRCCGCKQGRLNVEDLHFEHVARLCALDMNWPRQEVNAETFARAAGCADHAPGATSRDVLALGRPAVHGLRTRIASDHEVVVVAGMVRQRFDRREVARGDLYYWRTALETIPQCTVSAFCGGYEVMPAMTRFHHTCCRMTLVTAAPWADWRIVSCLGAPKNLPAPTAGHDRTHVIWARLMQL